MGPLTYGHQFDDVDWLLAKGPSVDDTEDKPITASMNATEILTINAENARRANLRKIKLAFKLTRNKVLQDWEDAEGLGFVIRDDNSESSASEKEHDEIHDQMDPTSAQFKSIRQYLFDNRRQLALDTLHTKSAEHQLLSYILANDGLHINATEWRRFLWTCTSLRQLFM